MTAATIDRQALRCTEAEWQAMKAATDREAARIVLPSGWWARPIPKDSPMFGQRAYTNEGRGLTVILSAGDHGGSDWLHVSVSRRDRIPSYEELAEVKRIFIGEDRQALQVFARSERHVNIHPRCLHLWCCLEASGDGLPDFGRHGSI